MYIFINLFILLLVLFMYIHINFNTKISNYLEIYEVDNPSKEYLEDICNKRQPALIKYLNIDELGVYDLKYLNDNYNSFELNIFNTVNNNNIKLGFSDSINLFKNDISCNYISVNNKFFLQDTTLEKTLSTVDMFYRPINTIYKEYDVILGSKDTYTKMKNGLFSRNYLIIVSGSIELSLTPPRYASYLHTTINYDSLESVSNIDIYNPDNNNINNINRVKILKTVLKPGDVFYIPSYWYYSFKILEHDTILYNFKYRTLMYNISILPKILISILQKNNTHHIFTKILETKTN